MHYCLSSSVDKEYLKKADEIRIKYNKLNTVFDLFEINPNATFIIVITSKENKATVNWN